MKYKCSDCDAIFDEEDAGSESSFAGYYGDQEAYEYFMCCPECGSDYIEEYEEPEEGDEEDEE